MSTMAMKSTQAPIALSVERMRPGSRYKGASGVYLIVNLGCACALTLDEPLEPAGGEACLLRAAGPWHMDCGDETLLFELGRELLYKTMLPLISDCPVVMEFMASMLRSQDHTLYLHFYGAHEGGELRRLSAGMLCEYEDKQPSYRAFLRGALLQLMALLSREYWVRTQLGMQTGTQAAQMLLYMNENLATVTLEDVARRFNYHANTIRSILRRETGKCFTELLKELRMQRARELLEETTLPVSTVAELCGYAHLGHFYKLFREFYGTTPRKMMS